MLKVIIDFVVSISWVREELAKRKGFTAFLADHGQAEWVIGRWENLKELIQEGYFKEFSMKRFEVFHDAIKRNLFNQYFPETLPMNIQYLDNLPEMNAETLNNLPWWHLLEFVRWIIDKGYGEKMLISGRFLEINSAGREWLKSTLRKAELYKNIAFEFREYELLCESGCSNWTLNAMIKAKKSGKLSSYEEGEILEILISDNKLHPALWEAGYSYLLRERLGDDIFKTCGIVAFKWAIKNNQLANLVAKGYLDLIGADQSKRLCTMNRHIHSEWLNLVTQRDIENIARETEKLKEEKEKEAQMMRLRTAGNERFRRLRFDLDRRCPGWDRHRVPVNFKGHTSDQLH